MALKECPYCRITVLPTKEGTCPACRSDIAENPSTESAEPVNLFRETTPVVREPSYPETGTSADNPFSADTFNPYQSPRSVSDELYGPQTPSQKLSGIDIFFGFQGRIPRRIYWMASIANMFAFYGVLFGLMTVFGEESDITTVGILLAYLPMFWVSLAVGVKRYHDHDKSGWWMLIAMIPMIGPLWQFIELGCLRGTRGRNRYGLDPT